MNREKYLFFDMDGTLISPTTHKIPDSAVDGIQQAMKNGHRCFICTGRSYIMAQEHFSSLKLPGIVFCNGAGIAYDGQILETRDIHPSVVKRVVDMCDALGGGYGLLTKHYTYQNQAERNRILKHWYNRDMDGTIEEMIERRAIKMVDEYQQEPVQKIDISFTSELTADIFFSRLPASLNVVLAGGYYSGIGRTGGELTANGVTKGTGVERVLNMFSATPHDAYVFGDSSNDIEMLRTCGTGIAMGNGKEICKRSADYITNDVDHDGIYNALKHFDLI